MHTHTHTAEGRRSAMNTAAGVVMMCTRTDNMYYSITWLLASFAELGKARNVQEPMVTREVLI